MPGSCTHRTHAPESNACVVHTLRMLNMVTRAHLANHTLLRTRNNRMMAMLLNELQRETLLRCVKGVSRLRTMETSTSEHEAITTRSVASRALAGCSRVSRSLASTCADAVEHRSLLNLQPWRLLTEHTHGRGRLPYSVPRLHGVQNSGTCRIALGPS